MERHGNGSRLAKVTKPYIVHGYVDFPSTHFPTISPGTPSAARSAALARSSRFGSLTCGTSRKIGTVARPRPVLDRDATARPLVFSRPSATSRLGPRLR